MLKQSIAPRGASFSIRPGAATTLVAAAALALAAFLGIQEGVRPGALAKAIAEGHEQTGREMSVLPAQASEAPPPEVDRQIRPARLHGEPPSIASAKARPSP